MRDLQAVGYTRRRLSDEHSPPPDRLHAAPDRHIVFAPGSRRAVTLLEQVITMSEMREAMQEVKRAMSELGRQVPEEMKGFSQFMGSVLKPGRLDLKTKELIALGMALTARCKYCIGIHTEKALSAGATPAEIWEVATVAIMMGGGPALTYVAELQKALEELAPDARLA